MASTVVCRNPTICGVANHKAGSKSARECAEIAGAKRRARENAESGKKSRFGFDSLPSSSGNNRAQEEAEVPETKFEIESALGEVEFSAGSKDSYGIHTFDDRPVMVNNVPVKIRSQIRRGEDGKPDIEYLTARRTDKDFGMGPVSDAAMKKIRTTLLEEAEGIFEDEEYQESMQQAEKDRLRGNLAGLQKKRDELQEQLREIEAKIAEAEALEP